ncbi:MAG: NADPH:quinone reductase-like Zn-dependent oxidoreductase [Candidatus Pelagisphaera sp.]|jgi:NADPH:quinone reductase-like Zn-dependent oxidoreductase
MKAVVYRNYGPPEVLRVEDVETPVPKDDEVLIRVHAAEATKADCELRSFNFPVKWFWLPLRIAMGIRKPRRPVLGGYFSGKIESVGKDVSKFKKGDAVFGAAQLRMGAYGEYLCLPDNYTIVPKPSNMTFAEAAAVPLGGLNAIHFLTKAKPKKGESILIIGAGGSIGTFGVQLAKAGGLEVTVVDSAIKESMLRNIGADYFIDYAKEDFAKNGKTYDVVFNMVARSSYSDCIKALKPKGHYVTANPKVSDMFRSVLTSKFTDKTATVAFAAEDEEELFALKLLIEAGKVGSVVDKVYPMEQAAEAHRRVETEQRIGSVVISIDS